MPFVPIYLNLNDVKSQSSIYYVQSKINKLSQAILMNIASWEPRTPFPWLTFLSLPSLLPERLSNAWRQLAYLSFSLLSSSLDMSLAHRSVLFPKLLSVQLLSFELSPVCLFRRTISQTVGLVEQLKAVKVNSWFLHSAYNLGALKSLPSVEIDSF